MAFYDKEKIKKALSMNDIFKLVDFLGGEPVYTNFGFIAKTICHNGPGRGSEKLYFYENTGLMHCYTNCGTMDIFDFVSKIKSIELGRNITFYESMDFIVKFFNLDGVEGDKSKLGISTKDDLQILANYKTLMSEKEDLKIEYKIYQSEVLDRLAFIPPASWLQEGIGIETMKKYGIKYYGTEHKIVIPHFNIQGDLIGIRGRAMVQKDVEMFGKYMPIKIGNIMYSHPLSQNLYGLNFNLENINKLGKIIIFEGEKSVLHYESMFGAGNNISVATCGRSLSLTQQEIIKKFCKVDEVIIAYDKEFKEIGDDNFIKNVDFLKRLASRLNNFAKVSVLFDKNKEPKLKYKDAPIDQGKEVFEYLYNNRIFL